MPAKCLAEADLSEFIAEGADPAALWLFLHIPKTAGTSISAELDALRPPYRNIFLAEEDYVPGPDKAERQRAAFDRGIDRMLADERRLGFRAVSGHLDGGQIERIRAAIERTRPFTFLRDPVRRVVSHYRYQCSRLDPLHESFCAQFPTLTHFVEEGPDNDLMTRTLALWPTEPVEDVIARVGATYDFVGIVEMYPMSFNLLTRLFGDNRMPTRRERVTPDEGTQESELTPDIRRRIAEKNGADQRLYVHFRDLLRPHRDAWRALLDSDPAAPTVKSRRPSTPNLANSSYISYRTRTKAGGNEFMSVGRLSQTDLDGFVREAVEPDAFWLFLHIPKTAGSSLSAELNEIRPPYHNIYVRDEDYARTDFAPGTFWRFLEPHIDTMLAEHETTHFRSASGHMMWPQAERIAQAIPETRLFTFLRDPVDRVISDYRYQRSERHPAQARFTARYPTIDTYVSASDNEKMYSHLCINQREPVDEVIGRMMERFSFVGLVEMYPFSFNVLTRLFGEGRMPTRHERAATPESETVVEVTPAIREQIAEANARDVAIYDHFHAMMVPHRDAWRQKLAAAETEAATS